jgi:membrane-associated phospholipid phosphatase
MATLTAPLRLGSAVLLGIAFLPFAASSALADSHKTLADTGTVVAIAVPALAGGYSVYKHDWEGVGELVIDTGLTVGTALALKQIVRERRPDHSDFKSFPSDTAALAFAPAAYLWDRYGWQYGTPAYLAGGFVAYSRVAADKHHYWDTLASAAIAIIYSDLVTTPYQPPIQFETNVTSKGAAVQLSYRW